MASLNMANTVSTIAHNYPFAFAGERPIMNSKERFYRQFHDEVADIQSRIGRLGSVATIGGERKDATDSILASISKLSLEVADAAEFIPAYDQRTYSATVKSLTDQLNQELARLAPAKPRFQFKKSATPTTVKADPRLLRGVPDAAKPAPSAASQGIVPATAETPDAVGALPSFVSPAKNYNAEISGDTSSASSGTASGTASGSIRKPSFSSAKEISITGHTGLHIILPLSASRATASGSITDMADSVVDMSVPTASVARGGGGAAFQSLMLRNVRRTLVVAGHVNGPVHMTGLDKCVLVVAARQVRIHECHDVDVYLQCSSRPIIEDCSGMRFAPLPRVYADVEEAGDEESKQSTQNKQNDQWDQVDDFKWLRAEPSPNWKVLPDTERLPESVWTGAVAGSLGLGTEDVLRAVGLGLKATSGGV